MATNRPTQYPSHLCHSLCWYVSSSVAGIPTPETFNVNKSPSLSPSAGVAGFVVNEKNELLLIQERRIRNLKVVHWKLPGGHTEPGVWNTDSYV